MISGAPRITLMASLIRLRELSPEREERRERRRMKERERERERWIRRDYKASFRLLCRDESRFALMDAKCAKDQRRNVRHRRLPLFVIDVMPKRQG